MILQYVSNTSFQYFVLVLQHTLTGTALLDVSHYVEIGPKGRHNFLAEIVTFLKQSLHYIYNSDTYYYLVDMLGFKIVLRNNKIE